MTSIEAIKARVSVEFAVPQNEMLSCRRSSSRARMVGMYLARVMTRLSFPQIGRLFGDKDHTTVMNAVRRIPLLMAIDPVLAGRVAQVRSDLEGAMEHV